MVERRILDDPLDALVQLELCGVTFEAKGDKLAFSGLSFDPATNEFAKARLNLIRDHKAEVIAWLGNRTQADALAQLEKTIVFLADQVSYGEDFLNTCSRKTEGWRKILIFALEKKEQMETTTDNTLLSEE